MSETDLISVVMSVHNEAAYVAAAISSILAQTHEEFELIIVDDYSTDDSLEVCQSFADRRIRIHRKTDEPPHLSASRNLGVSMARGQYVAFQDADDECDARRLEKQLAAAIEWPGRLVVGTGVRRVEGDLETIMPLPQRHENIVKGFERFRNRTTIVPGTILAPTTVLEEVPYRLRFRYMQDWDHILRLHESKLVRFRNCPEPLYTYYIRPKGVIHQSEWLDYNLFVRNCQSRRRRELPEFTTLKQFQLHLHSHPWDRCKWGAMRTLIGLNKAIKTARPATSAAHSQYPPSADRPHTPSTSH